MPSSMFRLMRYSAFAVISPSPARASAGRASFALIPARWRTGAHRRRPPAHGADVLDVGGSSLVMILTGSIAVTTAISLIASDGQMEGRMAEVRNTQENIGAPLLTHDQLQRELSYRAALSILRQMLDADLITQKEFVTIAPTLAEKFSPVWAGLYQLSA